VFALNSKRTLNEKNSQSVHHISGAPNSTLPQTSLSELTALPDPI